MPFKKFGKYTIIKKLASGGMADILLASDLSPTGFNRFLVIKRALTKFSDNEEFKDMFKNEGKVACNLKHRNINPIYEFGIEKNQFFLAMEYVSGKNVKELSKKSQEYNNPISIPNVIHIIKEVASGLNYAHNAIDSSTGQPLNLIHRDISPQNIMLSYDGEVKLIDFGIAKISDTNLTKVGHLKGKFSYMSPEQAQGNPIDGRTDIFCLGIILWELLTNKRLFASQNELSSLKKIKNCDIPDAQKINPKIPTELNNIVKKALSKNKNTRYETAAKLEKDLSIFLNKNYSEFSNYDFISLMKTLYRKDIMKERNILKSYSSDLKIYINNLNIENSLSISENVNFNLPDISTVIEGNSEKEESHELHLTDDMALSQYKSDSSHHNQTLSLSRNQTLSLSIEQFTKENATLLQKKEEKTTVINHQPLSETETHNIQSLNLKLKEPVPSSPLKLQDKLESHNDKINNLHTTQRTLTTSNNTTAFSTKKSLYSTHQILKENQKKTNVNYFSLLFGIVLLTGFSVAIYFITYNKLPTSISQFISNPSKITNPTVTKQTNHNINLRQPSSTKTQDIELLKIFIKSNPSGARILINKKFSKYTPTMLSLSRIKKSHITIQKKGYFSKSFMLDPKLQKNNMLNLKLKVKNTPQTSPQKIYTIE